MKDNNYIFGCIGMIASFLLILIGGSIAGGWALSVLWGWFIVPVFGLPALSVVQSIGIILITGYITNKPSQGKDERDTTEQIISNLSHVFVMPLFSVGIGWIVLQFM